MKNTLMALSLVLGLGFASAQQTTPAQKKTEPAKKEMKDHSKKEMKDHGSKEKKSEKMVTPKQEKTPA
ncbi:hypothetical protein, partial [Elizabethkingia meningoseptica]